MAEGSRDAELYARQVSLFISLLLLATYNIRVVV